MTMREEVQKEALKKASMSLVAVNALMTNSFELEHIGNYAGHGSRCGHGTNFSEMYRRLNALGGGCATNPAVNSGNGWNADSHVDGTIHYNELVRMPNRPDNWFDVETSSAPLVATSYKPIREELRQMLDIYEEAAGQIIHSKYASCHVHYTIQYMKDGNGNVITAIDIPADRIYRYIAKFMTRYNAVLKWLSMTNKNGARGAAGNSYDVLDRDELYTWAQMVIDNNFTPGAPTKLLKNMARGSYLRVHGQQGQLHWENRMMDCNASHTHMAAWMALGRAITLWAIDFGRNNYEFTINQDQLDTTKTQMANYRYGWRAVDHSIIKSQWQEIKGYLCKYLKVADCIDGLDILERLIEKPVPAWVEALAKPEHYNARHVEKSFGFRNRAKNTELHENYMKAIRQMIVPIADGLDGFHQNIADFLGIEFKSARGLYQMIKRDKEIELEFLGGRIVEI